VAGYSSKEDQLLRSALGMTAECLPVETLAAMAEHLPGADTDTAARAHVERCAYCRNELAMLMEFESATPRAEEAAAVAWIQGELARRAAGTPLATSQAQPAEGFWGSVGSWISRAFPSRSWQMVPVAAALLFVVAGGMYLRQGSEGLRPPAGGEPVWRSQQFAAVAPVGEVAAAPAELQWEAVPGAGKYLVRVIEVDRTEIWRAEASGTRIALPAEIRVQMTAGRTFLWMVTARDSAGRTVSETSLQIFHVSVTTR
jgi:hypothetical protein